MFNAQELNHRIEIQDYTTTTGPYNEEIQTWEHFADAFARVEPVVGREYFAAQSVQTEAPVKFTLRYLPGINTTMRIVYAGDNYDIQSAIDIKGKRREMLIYAVLES